MGAAGTYQQASQDQQRDELIVSNLNFVRHVLGRLVATLPETVDVENLESAGILGLVEAAHQFDSKRGVPFKAYAYPRIRGAIIDELRRNCPLPQQLLHTLAQVRRACETLEPPVTPETVAQATGLSLDQVDECLSAIRLTRPGTWEESRMASKVKAGDQAQRPDELAEQRETLRLLTKGIEQLPEKERLVLTLYYLEDLRLKEIGQVLELSESRVSRILSRAEFRLKEFIRVRS